MNISSNDWLNYINKLSKLNTTAGDLMKSYIEKHGFDNMDELVTYAHALVSKYGEGSAALAAEMYDELAAAQGVIVPPAEVAPTASYGETAKAMYGTVKQSLNPNSSGRTVSRLVKQAGQDTTLKNALRDGAEFAWIPSGDTCVFCLTLASRGWQKASKAAIQGGHAEHIHASCDCAYSIRFDGKSNVKGYDPSVYRKMYDNAEGKNSKEKIKSMRRKYYEENKDKINAQKRAAYAEKNGLSAAAGTLPDNMKKYVPNYKTRMKIIQDGITAEKPIFCNEDDLLYKLASNLPEEKGFYTVVLHGDAYSLDYKGQTIDPDTLCAIIAQRKDYTKGTDIRLISCYTGSEEDGVARYISDKLKVTVVAPDKVGIINRDIYGQYKVYSGSDFGKHDGNMIPFKYKKKEGSK